ncbi:MAG: Uma2 family endonuclease [Cyanobacteria bacterium]|nr:Uma2 family endonuclease [Cyanobacteriota bacterium]
MSQANLPHLRRQPLPTMYDLPSETVGEPALPDEFHRFQADLMEETCQPPTYSPDQIFIACDLYLYYDSRHPLWYKRPDWFLAVDVPRASQQQDLRLSYVIWQEGVPPFMVLELLSPGTEEEDLEQNLRALNKPPTKWEVYERILRVPYYVIYDRYDNHLRVFRLEGTRYQAVALPQHRLWIEELQLGLGLWQGDYKGITGLWLRWYDAAGEWVPTAQERAEQERLRAEQERLRAERLADYLRSQGIDPDSL